MNDESKSFLERFFSFNDAVIRSLAVKYRNSSTESEIEVTLSARDRESNIASGWVNVVMTIHVVSAFHFSESPQESYQVLSNDLRIVDLGHNKIFDFGYFVDPPSKPDEFLSSRFCVVGREFSWEVTPFKE